MAAPDTSFPPNSARISVLLPLPLAGPYDYLVPPELAVREGDFVAVPLAAREVAGVVWGPATGDVARAKLREVIGRLEVPTLPESLRRTIDWVANYTLSPPGAVLRMAMSVPAALEQTAPEIAFRLAPGGPPEGLRSTAARRRVLALLEDGPPRGLRELAAEAGVGTGVVRGLEEAGALLAVSLPPRGPFAVPDPTRPALALSDAQGEVAAGLVGSVRARRYRVNVLDGVPGAGKTEVYFEAVAAALEAGGQVLVLLPEIALTAQWLDRFEARFGVAPATWHSDLTQARRRLTWRAIVEGTARVVVGARSALFLPFPELGLIVVDEEHDASFKQEEGVCYHARDMAVLRAHLADIPVVLVSATPSLETLANIETGRYRGFSLPDRYGGARLPEIVTIDMRREPPAPRAWLSLPLVEALAETFGAGEQALLFLNRRGYAPLTLCRACGHRLECPNCTAWLVEHRLFGRLLCHHCGFSVAPPEVCPGCGAAESLVPCGPGVERLAEEVLTRFPDARAELVSSDRLRGPDAAQNLIRRIEEHELDLVIGTQILAKSHHFPLLTLVGVVDADLGLAGGDLRAAERTYQLLYQVAGRAGRAERAGRVLLQTYMPEHPVMAALATGDRESFLRAEAAERKTHGMPPHGRLAAVIVSGPREQEVMDVARALGRTAPRASDVAVLGPAPAPLAVLRGRHRQRLLLKAARGVNVTAVLRAWLAHARPPRSVRVQVDVDPYSFM